MNHNPNYGLNLEKGRAVKKAINQGFRDSYNKDPKKCLSCNLAISYERRQYNFCNHSCAAKVSNIGSNKHGTSKKSCKHCGTVLKRNSLQFCNQGCQYFFNTLTRISNGTASAIVLRNYLLKTDNSCNICSINEWQGKPLVLEMDHIDGDHKNNSIDNVRLLCPNCHAQTPTYKAKNWGNGREKRRKRIE